MIIFNSLEGFSVDFYKLRSKVPKCDSLGGVSVYYPTLKENECVFFYVHCFTHQFQLALAVVAKNHGEISELFLIVGNVVKIVGASFKRRDILKVK